jgi:hypothetical protein
VPINDQATRFAEIVGNVIRSPVQHPPQPV